MLVEEHQTLSAMYKRKHDKKEIELNEVHRVMKNTAKKYISLVIFRAWNMAREKALKESIKEKEKML